MKIKVRAARPRGRGNPQWKPGMRRVPRSGRAKGTQNKFTTLKQAFLDAFEGMGGAAELQRWGAMQKNRAQFYNMICKMLPKEVTIGAPADSPDSLPFTIRIDGKKP